MEEKFLKKINQWKKNLLDTSRRNPLINFRAYKRTTIKVVDEKPSEVFRQLINNQEKFDFDCIEEEELELTEIVESSEEGSTKLDESNHSSGTEEFVEYDKENLEDKHTDNTLQTNLEEQDLYNNLRAIEYKAQDILEEQGYNNLFLTLGMLEWYDTNHSDKKNRSPLILVPVQLKKKSIRTPYQIVSTEEDAIINLSLQEKLNENFNIKIPEIPDSEEMDPMDYFSQIKNLISENNRWKVTEEIYLGFFSFANFVMFKDLEKYINAYNNNSLIQAMSGASDGLTDKELDNYINADELDIKRKPHDVFQVLDADSSQQQAIEIIKSGRSLVLQGPPGTGKSQTIVNLISELLGEGKKVLFVCEKMAALEVVYDRLKLHTLDRFCLQIHSRKANKKDILNQLKSAFEFSTDKLPSTKYLDELVEKREKLNKYVEVLHTPGPPLNKTPFWILGQLNSLKDIDILNIEIEKGIVSLDSSKFTNILEVLETFKARIEEIGNPVSHTFWGSKIDSTSEHHQQRLTKSLTKYVDVLSDLIKELKQFKKITKINIESVGHAKKYCNLVDVLLLKHQTPKYIVSLENPREYYESIEQKLTDLKSYQKLSKKYLKLFENEIFSEVDFKAKKRDLKGEYSSFLRYFKSGYWSLRRELKGFAKKDDLGFSYQDLIKLCNDCLEITEKEQSINSWPDDLYKPLGDLWNGKETNVKDIEITIEWLIKYKEAKVSNDDDDKLMEFILNSTNIPDELSPCKDSLLKSIEKLYAVKEKVDKELELDESILYEDGYDNEKLHDIQRSADLWRKGIDSLVDWTRYIKAYNKCNTIGLGKYIDELIKSERDTELIVKQFKKKYYYEIFQNILKENEILAEFESLTHSQLVERFIELDKLQLDIAQARTLYNICQNKPDQNWSSSKSSGLGILQKQFRLSRRHMALRKLFKKAPKVIQQICPCFMMSPMSVAQYLDPEEIDFDVVIFDEASQIKPEHSVGSIVRGKQLVVVGDEKQLPPTSFFQKGFESSEEDDEDIMLDSILDECMTIDGILKSRLRWHYRSRDESLIQFSNLKYYDNELFTFPNSSSKSNLGVELHYDKNTVYDRGGSATNRDEAKSLIKHVIEQFKANPEKSIGVVALSQRQQAVLRAEKDYAIMESPSLQRYFDSGNIQNKFFIKNLETVQGDERDIIYISIGYGKDKYGKLSMNFGPINKEGGERRLNVLISRAREKVNVFSSITGDDFDLTKTQSIGAKYLMEYLDYAKSGGDIQSVQDAFDISNEYDDENPFERSVAQQMSLAGIKAIPQVGQSGYKIDFGIIDPDDSSKFILAVECDGASYHSSSTARDRDRLRQGVLENLGWTFHRIWSIDWFQNHKREMEKLKAAIIQAKSKNKANLQDSPNIELEYEEDIKKEKSTSSIKLIEYKISEIQYYNYAEEFYEEAESTWTATVEKFDELVMDILSIESPIHSKQLYLRVIQNYDMNSVGSRITRIMDRKIKRLKSKNRLNTSGDFIYLIDQKIDFIRTRVGTDMDENILYVSPDEINNAISYILEKEYFIPESELMMQIAKLLGYERTGPRMKTYLTKVIAKAKGTLIEEKESEIHLIN